MQFLFTYDTAGVPESAFACLDLHGLGEVAPHGDCSTRGDGFKGQTKRPSQSDVRSLSASNNFRKSLFSFSLLGPLPLIFY